MRPLSDGRWRERSRITGPRHDTNRPGWLELRQLVAAGGVAVVAVESLFRLFPSARSAILDWHRWTQQGVGLVSLDDAIDTCRSEDSMAFRIALAALERFESLRHAEATQVGVLDAQLDASGRQPGNKRLVVAVNHVELLELYHLGLSYRQMVDEIRRRGGRLSYGTLTKHLRLLKDQARLDKTQRQQAKRRRPSHTGRPWKAMR